jgi:hypothetical protein
MGVQTLLYEALNVPMRALLRSPLHGVASRNLCIVRYAGRRSGRRYETPLSYVRDGARVLLLSSRDTRWWTNFVPAAMAATGAQAAATGPGAQAPSARTEAVDPAVEVLVEGQWLRGRARTIHHDQAQLLASLRTFLTALPRDAVVYGIRLDGDRRPREDSLEQALPRIVMVEIRLEG